MTGTTVDDEMLARIGVVVNKEGPWCVPGKYVHRFPCRKCADRRCQLARDEVKPCNVCQRVDCNRAWYGVSCSNRRKCRRCASLYCDFAKYGTPCNYEFPSDDDEYDGF